MTEIFTILPWKGQPDYGQRHVVNRRGNIVAIADWRGGNFIRATVSSHLTKAERFECGSRKKAEAWCDERLLAIRDALPALIASDRAKFHEFHQRVSCDCVDFVGGKGCLVWRALCRLDDLEGK